MVRFDCDATNNGSDSHTHPDDGLTMVRFRCDATNNDSDSHLTMVRTANLLVSLIKGGLSRKMSLSSIDIIAFLMGFE